MTADVAELIAGPHAQRVRAWLALPDTSREVYLATPTSCTVTFDALRAPRVTAEVTVPTPVLDADADYTDHRKGARLIVEVAYADTAGRETTYTLADLYVRDRQLLRPSDELRVTAAGAEALIIDRPQPVALTYAAGASVASVVADVLTRTLGSSPLTNHGVSATLAGAVTADPGADLFDLLETVTDAAGAELYADELGRFHLVPEPVIGTPVAELRGGPGGTLTDLSADLRRDLYATRVLLVHSWTDTAARRIVGTATSPLHTGPARRARTFTRATAVTQATADAAAAGLLTRCLAAGGGGTVEAIADYRLRPGDTVTVTDELLGPRPVLLTSVRYDLDTGLMACAYRDAAPEG